MEEKWKAHGIVLKFETPRRHFHGDAARLESWRYIDLGDVGS